MDDPNRKNEAAAISGGRTPWAAQNTIEVSHLYLEMRLRTVGTSVGTEMMLAIKAHSPAILGSGHHVGGV